VAIKIKLGVRKVRILASGALVALAIALAFVVWDFNLDVFVEVFLSQPAAKKIAWMVVAAASLLLLYLALWQSEMLSKQHKLTKTLEHRLRGVGQTVHRLEDGQSDIKLAENYLLRTERSLPSRNDLAGLKRRYNRSICAMRQVTSRPEWRS
jgi:hypothetical protein